MNLVFEGKEYEVVVIKKDIKNSYIRVKNDLKIYVTTNYFTPNKFIKSLLNQEKDKIYKMLEHQKRKIEKDTNFYLLNKKYRIIYCNLYTEPKIVDDIVYTKNDKMLENYIRKYANTIFKERLNYCYLKMNDKVPYPNLKIRKMKRKWGYCNRQEKTITLNLDLIKYNIDEIDYVLIHELCHFIYFDHSKEFWKIVKYYKPNYNFNRKVLKEE